MPRQITLADIARKGKVSVATVSLVLRDRPGISPETRARVLAVARDLGYLPRPHLSEHTSAQPAGQLRTVGVILKAAPGQPPESNAFYAHVLASIEAACRRNKLNLLYATLPVDEDNFPLEVPPLLAGTPADGYLLLGAFVDETLGRVLGDTCRPVVLVDAYTEVPQYDSVVSDNLNGAFEATSALIARGHREIGLVGGHIQAYPSLDERCQGCRRALRAHGLHDTHQADCALDDQAAMRAATALLADHPEITALVCVNDVVAIASLRAAQALGRRVPQDLSVIGFDDIDLARQVTPALTTMHVDKAAMGQLAMLLLAHRYQEPGSAHVTAVLRPRLIERDSARSPAGNRL